MVDIQPQSTQPISDDQELAKVLAGVTEQTNNDLSFEETPVTTPIAPESPSSDLPTPSTPVTDSESSTPIGYNPPADSPAPSVPDSAPITPPPVMPAPSGDLEGIKKDALNELRPLVDKLELEPEEKFDTYLLLLRSTDDKALIAPAHAAARAIPDESRRAKALLDVIKEIDFLSNPQ